MRMDQMSENYSGHQGYVDKEAAVRRTMLGVYGWMTLALIISAITGLYIATNETLLLTLAGSSAYWIVAIAEVVVVLMISGRAHKMSSGAAKGWFVVYALLNGVTFGSIFAIYGLGLAGYAFLVTAFVFGVMTIYGYVTKTDLSRIGNLFVMALFGLVIASVVGIFIPTPGYTRALMYVGVVIFIGLIGYDTQKIKEFAYAESEGMVRNASILGALTLYLDFINIFVRLVSILGRDE
ncbi:MAG: Bax inhibitor-1/YccA family protein [Cellulosilyticum sp.]|nr:Bax inhibitor-1/YccA family protein [Cellulosilyticum sp.]